MLTVDFERLDLQPGHRLLDLGCGGGRHAFEAMRRGAAVTALDASFTELQAVRATSGGMLDAAEITDDSLAGAVTGDALCLPFPDGAFDRIIASEVLEHIWEDERAISELWRVLAPGGRLAVTVPNRWPERVCWALDSDYHDTPGGHVRIYERSALVGKLARPGFVWMGTGYAHALHAPYWWLRCAVGVQKADASWMVRRYRNFLVWDIMHRPAWVAKVERTLSPVLGKSIVLYLERPLTASPDAEVAHAAA